MARYATKKDLLYTIRNTIERDFKSSTRMFNIAGIVRDLRIIGDRHYGYTMEAGPEEFSEIVRRHYRGIWK